MRPNIRVEIQNNLVTSMEVDEDEEGEIREGGDKELQENHFQSDENVNDKLVKPTVTASVEAQDKSDQEKLKERARRFRLAPNEIRNFTSGDFQQLSSSLGITSSNEVNVRFEIIHMLGIEEMDAGDILDYFLEYTPTSVEWIGQGRCNVVWADKIDAARALHFMSKPVRGMPVRDDSSYYHMQEREEINRSILLLNKDRQIQSQEGNLVENCFLSQENAVDISEIAATIPPGYWRLGIKHPHSKCILLRFALKTDKKHFKVDQFARYYKSPIQNKVVKAKVSRAKQGIFGRNKDMFKDTDNPWSVLAKNWDEDSAFRERERNYKWTEEPKIEIKNQSLRVRLGSKRKEEVSEPETQRAKIPRMKMYADEEEEKIQRKKMLQRLDKQIRTIEKDSAANSDLRTVLNMSGRTHGIKLNHPKMETFDLGTTLKNRNKKMIFEIKTEQDQDFKSTSEKRVRRDSDNDDDSFRRSSFRYDKPQSKVAVVIKTQKKPSVASAVASTMYSHDASDSDSNSQLSESEQSESENEEIEEAMPSRSSARPGFSSYSKNKSLSHYNYKRPLKIEINNDHFRRT